MRALILPTATVIAGIEIPSTAPVFLGVVGFHVLVGLACVVTGAGAMLSRKAPGRHPNFGAACYWGLVLSIRPVMQRALLASMRFADRRPIILAGICGPIEPTGLADPGPTGCHHTFVRPRTAEK